MLTSELLSKYCIAVIAEKHCNPGEAGDGPAVLLIVYAGTPGIPTSVPAKDEKTEY
jgi:hypothetical protein